MLTILAIYGMWGGKHDEWRTNVHHLAPKP